MAADLPKRIARRLLRGIGLATSRDVARARHDAAARVKQDARAKSDRDRTSAAAKLRALQSQLESRHEQDVVNHGERSTLRKALAFHWERLDHLEAVFGDHVERLRMQLDVALAVRSGSAEWRLPAAPDAGEPATVTLARRVPLDELAVSRQFVVGGVMLDIGAGYGQTSIPRALLGDFDRIYAVEGREAWYRCLTANVAASRVGDVVVPDQTAIATGTDFETWLTRLQVPAARVRFVRIGAHPEGLETLREALHLFPRRDVVWQLDLDPTSPLVTSEGFLPVGRLIGKHFTHFKELGLFPAEPWRKAVEARRLFKREDAPRPSGLLLFNLR